MARARRKRKKIKFRAVLGLAVIVLIIAGGTLLFQEYAGTPDSQKHPERSYLDVADVVVEQGASTADIAAELKEKGVIRYPLFFRMMSRLGGHDADYKQGTFVVERHIGYHAIFRALSDPAGGQAGFVKVTIPEGFELRQIADRLEEAGLIDRDVFYNLVESGQFDYAFVREIPKRENRLEGYLFPDTYSFSKTADTEQTIINAMLKRFEEVVYTQENRSRARALGLSMDEAVTLASIVEREALGENDRKDVSSVFHNRLASKEFPYLQSCATVQYILKERKAVLSEADTQIKSAYNTYQVKGLPLGPIASPGAASVEAALYPNRTDYLFFVLGSDGVHHFSKTYEEHLAHMKK